MSAQSLKTTILEAAKAHAVPAGSAGMWAIRKFENKAPLPCVREGRQIILPAGRYTHLLRWTLETIGKVLSGDASVQPECVMEDTQLEISKHLQFMLSARGRVLITGLGLGCVLRGTLANPSVQHVTLIERDSDVLKLVQPFLPNDRFTIIQADARQWVKHCKERFDCAWHDLWSDPDAKEPHLQRIHMKLVLDLRKRVPMQGAWEFPRLFRRVMKQDGVL